MGKNPILSFFGQASICVNAYMHSIAKQTRIERVSAMRYTVSCANQATDKGLLLRRSNSVHVLIIKRSLYTRAFVALLLNTCRWFQRDQFKHGLICMRLFLLALLRVLQSSETTLR